MLVYQQAFNVLKQNVLVYLSYEVTTVIEENTY